MTALPATAAAACSLAAARGAIRTTRTHVPALVAGTPPVRADAALADEVVCFGGALAVSIASGGTAGDTAWVAFARDGAGWRVLRAGAGYKLRLVLAGGKLEVVQPVYRRADPNCCPTGGFDRVLYRLDGRSLVVAGRRHTRASTSP